MLASLKAGKDVSFGIVMRVPRAAKNQAARGRSSASVDACGWPLWLQQGVLGRMGKKGKDTEVIGVNSIPAACAHGRMYKAREARRRRASFRALVTAKRAAGG